MTFILGIPTGKDFSFTNCARYSVTQHKQRRTRSWWRFFFSGAIWIDLVLNIGLAVIGIISLEERIQAFVRPGSVSFFV